MYSQAPLLALLRAGKVPGESSFPKHIETVISNIFLFDERVYKVYKNDNDFVNKNFGDISTKEKRFAFSETDFEWNHQLARGVYLHLQGVKVESNSINFVDNTEDAEELLLVTKRLSAENSLFEHLQNTDLNETDYYEIGKQFARREKDFVLSGMLPGESSLENMTWRLHDVLEWVKGVEEYIPREERETYAVQLKALVERIYTHDSRVAVAFDVHSLNAFYEDGVFYPFDVVASKDSWRFAPASVSIYRLATDVSALVGEKEFRAVLRGYFDYLHKEPPLGETERFLVIYAALIMVPYLFMLSKTDPDKRGAAEKYHDFLKRYTSRTLDV